MKLGSELKKGSKAPKEFTADLNSLFLNPGAIQEEGVSDGQEPSLGSIIV